MTAISFTRCPSSGLLGHVSLFHLLSPTQMVSRTRIWQSNSCRMADEQRAAASIVDDSTRRALLVRRHRVNKISRVVGKIN